MQRQRFAGVRRSGIALVATALVVLGQAAQASQRATVSASDPGQLSQAVTLITGERVLVGTSPGGIPTARILPAAGSGPAMPLNTVHMGGDTYVIPASAEPYMSRYLDPNLFDVTRLSDAGITGRVPLRLTFTPGTTPSIPGVTITTSSSGVASGYVTAASAPRFGAALAAQAYADQQAGWPASSSLFGSITAISADVAAPPVTVPNFPMVTLIIHAISHTGGDIPFGFGFLMNQDDGAKYTGFVFLVNGEARVSVPVGTYLGLMDEWVFSANNGVTTRVMVASGYAVSAGGQTMTFDARQATAAPSVSTPKPSAAQELDVTFDASDAVGHYFVSWGYGFGFPGSRVFLTPAASPTVGTLSETTRWIRVDPSVPGGTYTYDATFQDPGVPADQSHTIPGPARSAAIDATYHADRLGQMGATLRLVFIPGSFFAFADGIVLTMPTHRTEYVVAPAGSVAEDDVLANVNSWFDPGWFQGGIESVDPGIVRAETWLRDPFSMGVPAPTAISDGFACLACRSTGRMTFVMFPQDGDPTHAGLPFGSPNGSPVAHFTVYLDGTQLLSKTDRLGAIFSVPTTTGTYWWSASSIVG